MNDFQDTIQQPPRRAGAPAPVPFTDPEAVERARRMRAVDQRRKELIATVAKAHLHYDDVRMQKLLRAVAREAGEREHVRGWWRGAKFGLGLGIIVGGVIVAVAVWAGASTRALALLT